MASQDDKEWSICTIRMGPRSMQEYFVLEECVSYCAQECIDITTENILVLYNVIADISSSLENIQLRVKQMEDIQCFIKEHDLLKSSFESICVAGITSDFFA